MKRWPELKVQKPRSLEIIRAKATSLETVNKYFDELEHILKKYNLKNRPQAIYNIDEKGIVENHTAPCIVSSHQEVHVHVPPAVSMGKSSTITVIGCGNALDMALPRFSYSRDMRMRKEFLSGCTAGTVSDSGWYNSDIFQRYLEDHFSKYSIPATSDNHLLILYDGHKISYVTITHSMGTGEKISFYLYFQHTLHIFFS